MTYPAITNHPTSMLRCCHHDGFLLLELMIALSGFCIIIMGFMSVIQLNQWQQIQTDAIIENNIQYQRIIDSISYDLSQVGQVPCLESLNQTQDLTHSASSALDYFSTSLSGYDFRSSLWYPFNADINELDTESDAIAIRYIDNSRSYTSLEQASEFKKLYVGDCQHGEFIIPLLHDSSIQQLSYDTNQQNILSLYSVRYYLKNATLYKQQLSQNNRLLSRPFVDQVQNFRIYYAESEPQGITFKRAKDVIEWSRIKAIWMTIKIKNSPPISLLAHINDSGGAMQAASP